MTRLILLGLTSSLLVSACAVGSEDAIPPQDPALVAAGSELYQAHCAECHGADLRGTDKGPSHLSQLYEPGHHGDGAFLVAVLRGVPAHHWNFGAMPPIQGLTPDNVEAIVAFVRERQRIDGFEPIP
jgi:mono/diheme cytochrome c family protein